MEAKFYNKNGTLTAYAFACSDFEFWKNHGRYGDGKLETAKAERKLLAAIVLERMERGNV